MKKKVLCALLCATMVMGGLVGCGNNKGADASADNKKVETNKEEEPEKKEEKEEEPAEPVGWSGGCRREAGCRICADWTGIRMERCGNNVNSDLCGRAC